MIIHKDSHLDHGLTNMQVGYIAERFAARDGFFVETFELPPELGTVTCGLHGPMMGDEPVADDEVTLTKRGERTWPSRLVGRTARQVRTVTVIAGPHDGHACVLYTAFGGPLAPKEPGDVRRELNALEHQRGVNAFFRNTGTIKPGESITDESEESIYARIVALRAKRAESDAFWAQHALTGGSK